MAPTNSMTDRNSPKARESTHLLAAGLGIGAFGVLGALVGSAVCPVCVVATPALLGAGLYKRWKERVREPAGDLDTAPKRVEPQT